MLFWSLVITSLFPAQFQGPHEPAQQPRRSQDPREQHAQAVQVPRRLGRVHDEDLLEDRPAHGRVRDAPEAEVRQGATGE